MKPQGTTSVIQPLKMRITTGWDDAVIRWHPRRQASLSPKERLASASSACEQRVHGAPHFSDLSSYKYIRRIEQIGRTLGLKSPFFRPNERRVG